MTKKPIPIESKFEPTSKNEPQTGNVHKDLIDVKTAVDEYLSQADWRVKANANQGYSLGGLILNVSGKVIANYWLNQIYAPEMAQAHRTGDLHIHDLDMLSGYCAGWSLRTLLTEGFNGVPGKVEANPPKHLSSAIGQMVNFLGTLQNEWAGAVAFSSTDSYLAPFVRKDNLSYREVKQCIQELIYNLNVPSRWGCVPLDTEILTKEGWKSKEEISVSDKVYGFQDGKIIDDEILAINEHYFDGELIAFSNRSQEQLLTPNHRVLRLGYNNKKEKFFVNEAKVLFEAKSPINMPVAGHTVQEEYAISDDLLQSYASEKEYPINILRKCSERQIKLFIHAYIKENGNNKRFHITTQDEKVKEDFQELAVLIGYGTHVKERKNAESGDILYAINFLTKGSGKLTLTIKKKVKYQGKVWCPTTRSSYWIARRKGSVFVTGNSQTPFTNLTFDWVCPDDLRDQVAYIGSEEMPFSYGDLQAEMDMINRAFIELMTEGDAKGRIFTFPLPTYNITADFPWDSPNVDLLFEMTAKYGLPYFQGFIRSDLKPSMVRSMCLFPEETILFKDNEQIRKTTIGTLFSEYKDTQLDNEWWQCQSNVSALSLNPESGKLEWVKVNKLLRITDNRLVSICSKDGKQMRLSAHHLVAILTREGIETKTASDITTDDFLLVIKNASRVLNPESVTDDDIELAWFIGLFIADGNYLYDTRYEQKRLKGVQISFNLQDKELIEKCKCFVKKRLNYEMKFILDKRYENSLYGYINNRKFAEFLCVEKGVQKYETLPSWLWNVGVPVILSFIDGFFSGDGCKAGKEIHINDEKLAQELNLLLQMVGISTTYLAKKHSQVIRIQHTLGRGSKGNKLRRDKLHDFVPQFLLDKRFVRNDNGKTLYQSYGRRTIGLSTIDRWDLTNEKVEWLRNSDFAAVPVASVNIENLSHPQEFYDIELEKNHYFVHSDGNISHNCCRLQLDLRELLKRGNGLFGSAEQTGSLGVVTINCARLGYLYKGDETGLYQRLDTLLELGKDSLEIKREVIQHYMDNGLFPFTKRYLGTLRNHFSTLGVNGINEMIRNFTDDQYDITTSNGQAFAIRLLDHIRTRMVEFQEETGHMYNLEATPAEGATYRFAKEDKKRYPDILQAGTPDKPYYTNSSQLPVGFTDDPFEALELQDELQTKYTGGCIEKGNKVITDKGAINIEEIVNNFQSLSPISALSYNPKTGQSEWDLITEAMMIDVAKPQKITIFAERGIKITTSDWHPFFVMEQITFSKQCPLCDKPLKNKNAFAAHLMHRSACRENYRKRAKYKVVEKRADELKKGDYILQNAQNLLPEKSQLNSELAYLLGFVIGDGSIAEVKKNRKNKNVTHYRVRFFSKAKPTLEKIVHILNHCFDCEVKPLKDGKHERFIIETTAITDLLFQYHLITGNKADTSAIPAEVKRHLSKENFYSFLAGLIDSDGHIDKRDGNIEYCTVSEKMADDIVEMCTIAGVLSSKHGKITRKKTGVIIYRVVISASQTTLLKEKLPLQKGKTSIKDGLSNRLKRHLPIVRVSRTSKLEVQDNEFYDLTTKHNHNYLAGNNSFVFVHNTVLHLYMNERISGAQACKALVRKVLEHYRLPYITITPTFSICPVHGYLAGEHEFCPLCDDETIAKKEGALLHD